MRTIAEIIFALVFACIFPKAYWNSVEAHESPEVEHLRSTLRKLRAPIRFSIDPPGPILDVIHEGSKHQTSLITLMAPTEDEVVRFWSLFALSRINFALAAETASSILKQAKSMPNGLDPLHKELQSIKLQLYYRQETIKKLWSTVKSEDKYKVVESMRFRPQRMDSVEFLFEALGDSDPRIQEAAAWVLHKTSCIEPEFQEYLRKKHNDAKSVFYTAIKDIVSSQDNVLFSAFDTILVERMPIEEQRRLLLECYRHVPRLDSESARLPRHWISALGSTFYIVSPAINSTRLSEHLRTKSGVVFEVRNDMPMRIYAANDTLLILLFKVSLQLKESIYLDREALRILGENNRERDSVLLLDYKCLNAALHEAWQRVADVQAQETVKPPNDPNEPKP